MFSISFGVLSWALFWSADRLRTVVNHLWPISGWIAFHRAQTVIAAILIGLLIANVRLGRRSRGPTSEKPKERSRQRAKARNQKATRPQATARQPGKPKQHVSAWQRFKRILRWARMHAGQRFSRSLKWAIVGVWLSTGAIAVSAFVHCADLQWLPPNQRHGLHISAHKISSGKSIPIIGSPVNTLTNLVNGAMESFAGHLNTGLHPVLIIPAELRGIWIAAHVFVQYGLTSMASFTVVAVMGLMWFRRYRKRNDKRLDTLEVQHRQDQNRIRTLWRQNAELNERLLAVEEVLNIPSRRRPST